MTGIGKPAKNIKRDQKLSPGGDQLEFKSYPRALLLHSLSSLPANSTCYYPRTGTHTGQLHESPRLADFLYKEESC